MNEDHEDHIDAVAMALEMWADKHRFGAGLDEEHYWDACEQFAERIENAIYDALRGRWPNV